MLKNLPIYLKNFPIYLIVGLLAGAAAGATIFAGLAVSRLAGFAVLENVRPLRAHVLVSANDHIDAIYLRGATPQELDGKLSVQTDGVVATYNFQREQNGEFIYLRDK